MSLAFGLALYFLIWWTVLFATLPVVRGKTQAEVGDVLPGTPESAQVRMPLLRIVIVNSIVAAVVFVIVVWAMDKYLTPYTYSLPPQ